mmetsp:Transcript_36112/g.103866  ORF Transcript_36112/g.103866 Transcript_36112/m.103866 type:complete len:227 (-) Transcript_36112:84-764(-)
MGKFPAGPLAAVVALHVAIYAFQTWRQKKKDEEEVAVKLPEWTKGFFDELKDKEFSSDEEMMRVAVDLSKHNVEKNTGGPFGCAIFEKDKKSGKAKIFSIGANQVTALNNSTLHAEMMAIQFAQKKMKTFSLKDKTGEKEYCLFTSCEPCAMCLGGTFWSGVTRLVCAATKADAEAIGFDEGPVFPESYTALEKAGCAVSRSILREDAAKVLKRYGEIGVIYNGHD